MDLELAYRQLTEVRGGALDAREEERNGRLAEVFVAFPGGLGPPEAS